MAAIADLSDERLAALATRVEDTQRELGRIRYGSVFPFGAARVVLNPDSPLASANFAATFRGSPAAAEDTLARLPDLWAEAGRSSVVVVESPSSVPELGVLAEEVGFEAVDEHVVRFLTDPARLVEGEPGRVVTPLSVAAEDRVVPLLADAFDYSSLVEARLVPTIGQRLDDPRVAAFAAVAGGDLVGVALAFLHGSVGQVTEVAVLPAHRRRRFGRALASAAAAHCLVAGARLVFAVGGADGPSESFWTGLGFSGVYESVTYVSWG